MDPVEAMLVFFEGKHATETLIGQALHLQPIVKLLLHIIPARAQSVETKVSLCLKMHRIVFAAKR